MKKRRIIESAVCFVLAGVLCALSVFIAVPALTAKSSSPQSRSGIVRLWNIDTFEGGKGSRSAFLNRISAAYEKAHDGVYIMVSSYTAEGAAAAIREGNLPDMLSFGIGFSEAAESCLKINGRSFAGGLVGKECRAVPWCRAGNAVLPEDGFEDAGAANTVVSLGGSNQPLAAAALLPLTGNIAAEESTSAYVRFLNGKYKYLLGTQRDVCRFASRGVNVYCKPISDYSDLYQYIAVTSRDAEIKKICDDYVESLLGENQKKLTEIGMLSPYATPIIRQPRRRRANARIGYTLNVFTSAEGLNG
ncbi:MAG: hypothetical protein ACLRSW_16735 [Christensenellaceae bacterium]